MKNYITITNDTFFISSRLKEIDNSYFVKFDIGRKKYELHSFAQSERVGTYCLTFPYDTLDERALTFARKTRSERRQKLFEEMERENENYLKRFQEESKEKILKEVL